MKMFALAAAASRHSAAICLNPSLSCSVPLPVVGVKFSILKISVCFLYQYTLLSC